MRLLALPGLGQAMMALQPSGADGARKGLAMVLGEPTAAKADPLLIEAAARGAAIPGARRSFRTLLARALTLSGARPEMAFGAADLARVRAPLLLLWGRDDVFGEPSAIDRARAARPDLAAEVLPGGHLPWLDDPARCGRSVRGFLDGRLAAATVRAPPAAAPIPAP
jgi:pimeloyl-ACP methyl ester carboxylesterase